MKLIKQCLSCTLSVLREIRNEFQLRKFKKAVNILSPYTNVELENEICITEDRGKIVWQLWLQGEGKAPPVVQKCFDSVKQHLPKGYRRIILDEKTLKDWIEIPDYLERRYQSGHCLASNYADYIRTCLLVKYGGIWIDATVYLSGELPKEIVESDIFVFKNSLWCHDVFPPKIDFFNYIAEIDLDSALYGSNWFIVAKPGRAVLRVVKKAFEDYWNARDYQCYYFMFHILFSLAIISRQDCREEFNAMCDYPNNIPHLFQRGFHIKYCKTAYETLMNITHIHKLTYRHGNIVQGSMLEHFLKFA